MADSPHDFQWDTAGRGRLLSEATWNSLSDTLLGAGLALPVGIALEEGRSGFEKARGTFVLVETHLCVALFSTVLKEAVGRPRPNGTDDLSFPSQHAAHAFASSTTLALESDFDPVLTATSGAIAVLTGSARVGAGEHHWTDVLAGAVLGGLVAWGVHAVGR